MLADEATVAAAARVNLALEHLEEARRQMDSAMKALCPVQGLSKEWTALSFLDEKVQSMAYRVRRRRDRARRAGILRIEGAMEAVS